METDWLIFTQGLFPSNYIDDDRGTLMALQYVTRRASSFGLFFVLLLDFDKMDSGKDNFATVRYRLSFVMFNEHIYSVKLVGIMIAFLIRSRLFSF